MIGKSNYGTKRADRHPDMPLNSTDEERQEAANGDLAQKIALEAAMATALRSLFAQIGTDLEAFFTRTGQTPDAAVYSPELQGILQRQFRRTGRTFSGQIIEFLRTSDEDDPTRIILTQLADENGMTFDELVDDMEQETILRQQAFQQENIPISVDQITDTTQRDLDSAIILGTLLLAERGVTNPTRTQVAKAAKSEFKRITRSRPETISTTETQKAAEGTKQIDNDVFFANRNRGFAAPLQQREVWVTRGDEKVRPAHVEADNTEKTPAGFFIVGGERLRFPGDTELGASPGNTINCRCASVLVIDDRGTPTIVGGITTEGAQAA